MSDDFNTRLSRWSQRKLAARRGVVDDVENETARNTQAPASDRPTQAPAVPADNDDDDDAPVLPSIDELTADSDYTVFLGKNVPELLKRAALRKLWRSDPVLANLDGLNDYDENFNVVDTLITSAQTSYQVGKGYLDDIGDKIAKLEPANSVESDTRPRGDSPPASSAPQEENDTRPVSEIAAPGDDSAAATRQVSSDEPGAESSGQAGLKTD